MWEWIDFERGLFRFPDGKTGAKVVPFGEPVAQLLRSLPRLKDNPYVLPGRKEGGHYTGLQSAWESIRKRAGLEGVRLHDLRHCFAAFVLAGGESLYILGKALGHKQARSTEIYAHLHDAPLVSAVERAATTVRQLIQV